VQSLKAKSWPPTWLTPVPAEALNGKRAQVALDFVDVFGIITKDSVAGGQGERLILRDWQRELIRHIYAEDSNGGFKHRVALVGLPRKNGKSALASTLALADLYLLGGRGAEVYSIAAEKEQARIVFADAKRIIEAHEDLSKLAKLYRDAIEIPTTSSVYRVLSAEAYSKEGLSPTSVWADELHAHPTRELYDVMSLAMGARGNKAHMVAITTAGVRADQTGKDSIAYTEFQRGQRISRGEDSDPAFFMAWWSASDEADHRKPETWAIANPGLGDICAVEDFESAVRRTPEPEFRTKRMNQWVSSINSWLPAGAWDSCRDEFEIKPEDEIVLGFDGSFSGDASVIVGATIPKDDEPVRVFMVKAWEKDLNIHDDDWRVDIAEVEDTIRAFCQSHPNVREIACDPFRWQRSMQALEEAGLPIVEWPSTSPARMVPACAKFYDAVMDSKLKHDGDGTLARHLDNAAVKIDRLGPRIVKENRNSPRKIDAAVAAVIAVDRALVSRLEAIVPQVFV
jgi:phage terminase large subunit-like protein